MLEVFLEEEIMAVMAEAEVMVEAEGVAALEEGAVEATEVMVAAALVALD